MGGLCKLPPYFGETHIQDVFENRFAAHLTEHEVKETSRYDNVRNYIGYTDAIAGMFGDICERLLHKRRSWWDVGG